MINVVIADSQQLTRFGLKNYLGQLEGINIAGEAVNELQLLNLCSENAPDVIIIDYLSSGFTVDSVHLCKNLSRRIKLIAITSDQSPKTILDALKAGIQSYIKKDCSLNEIEEAVKRTSYGEKFFCGQILQTIEKAAIDPSDSELTEFTCEPVVISDRELEVIKYIAEGYTNGQIAEKLFLSNHTVNTHRKNIMQKLGVNNTASLVMYAVKTQLVSPNKFLFSPSKS